MLLLVARHHEPQGPLPIRIAKDIQQYSTTEDSTTAHVHPAKVQACSVQAISLSGFGDDVVPQGAVQVAGPLCELVRTPLLA